MSELRGALERSDAGALARSAHTLKGSLGNFCANHAFAAAFELEKMGESGDLSLGDHAYSELQAQVELLEGALQEERCSAT
jgi:HPt (histidine-containing phosphotransfer) domain-containing protein